jgi:hypothetical protein
VTDEYNNLLWQQEDNKGYFNWFAANGKYDQHLNPSSVNICGDIGLGGRTGWRLPTESELRSIQNISLDGNGNNPDKALFPVSGTGVYWSSTQDGDSFAMVVAFRHGTFWSTMKAEKHKVRCVTDTR